MLAANTDTLVVIAILLVRLIVPLFIPRFPLPAILVCLVVDAADQTILQQATDFSLDRYQSFDKALDIYYLAIAYLTVFRNWTNGFGIIVAAFLWYYRLVGVLLFEILGYRWLLMAFPNTFEYFFIAYCVIQTRWNPLRMTHRAVIGLAAFIWIFIKLPQEWWIHVAQNDFTDFMKETVFGVEPTSSWSDAFSNRPGVLLALVLVIVGIAVVGWRMRKRLPTADWSFGLDMNRTDAVVRRVEPVPTSMRAAVLEKIALIALIGGIFANVLEVETTGLKIVGATLLIVLANAGLSIWLARRGNGWSSLALESVVLAIVNTTLLIAYAAIVGDGEIDRSIALFFGLLLTVLIVLYDRYRPATSQAVTAGA
ncbi:MAG TPA: hypothetical protein VES40_11715 [Ilumatobacteraceae bacterium]|nr:hypothetical protein [Ilumatobacteraceae bacterium]